MNLELILQTAGDHLAMANESPDNLGHADIAVFLYSKAIKIDPDNPITYNDRGFAFGTLKQYDNAIKDYTKALDIDQHFAPSYFNLGFTYKLQGKYNEAITNFSAAIKINSKPKYYFDRGETYRLMDNVEFAQNDYLKVLELFDEQDEKTKSDYKLVIRAERRLIEIGVLSTGKYEMEALKNGIITNEDLKIMFSSEE